MDTHMGLITVSQEKNIIKVEVSEGSTVLKDQNDQVVNQASFILSQNDSVVSGAFKLNGQVVTGLTGEVHAMRVDGDGWQTTAIEDNGTYELTFRLLESGRSTIT